ncbi:MAG TPA: hypothetical protein VFE51_02580 [Verrucomicrobiae bacterium]|nr:hypothetical protein [Verrucomicrobiae bacterium]
MASIHLIRNDPKLPQIKPLAPGSALFQSGYWVISEDKAKALKGGKIFFHEKQSEPAFFGGEITEFQKVAAGEYAGRIIFVFKPDQTCKGFKTPTDGWAQEMKIIR